MLKFILIQDVIRYVKSYIENFHQNMKKVRLKEFFIDPFCNYVLLELGQNLRQSNYLARTGLYVA